MNLNSIASERLEYIKQLLPELDRRYAQLRALLVLAEQGEAVDEPQLWLAHSDLAGITQLILTGGFQDEDDE